ncbi:hypothetical protein [Streptomyces sp. NBC_01716]|uniref:hypothetical protein n=1 Tax=Streptomyces sp. NBC_01716 TaxID=2975917 RepID=UPI002E315086|nr:hypothetical protein [Streptomyces sp. NBC_01716]
MARLPRPDSTDTRYPVSVGQRECADALPDGLDGDERDAWNKGCITGMLSVYRTS